MIDFGARATARDRGRSWFGVPQWAAMAATLALGLVVGNMVGEPPRTHPCRDRDGSLVAAAALDQALDQQLASVLQVRLARSRRSDLPRPPGLDLPQLQ